MSFFDAFTEERAQLAFDRTKKNIEYGCKYASKHPVESALVIGSLVTLMVFIPAPVMLALLVSALALICFNLFTPQSHSYNTANFLSVL